MLFRTINDNNDGTHDENTSIATTSISDLRRRCDAAASNSVTWVPRWPITGIRSFNYFYLFSKRRCYNHSALLNTQQAVL